MPRRAGWCRRQAQARAVEGRPHEAGGADLPPAMLAERALFTGTGDVDASPFLALRGILWKPFVSKEKHLFHVFWNLNFFFKNVGFLISNAFINHLLPWYVLICVNRREMA